VRAEIGEGCAAWADALDLTRGVGAYPATVAWVTGKVHGGAPTADVSMGTLASYPFQPLSLVPLGVDPGACL
jgi:hypothetical protein